MDNRPFDKLFKNAKPSDVTSHVGELASIWKNAGQHLMELNAYLITRYCMTQDFDPSELQAYKKALVDLEVFLHEAEEEVDALKAPKES